jgi:hypothetical protein
MSQLALAERYRELGFHVIEGGKSGKLVVMSTLGFAWAVGEDRHGNHLMRIINNYRKKLDPNLGQAFDEHCRPSKYKGRDGRKQDCFDLTQTGVLIFGAYYDASLLFLLALLFEAVTTNENEADCIIGQIKARLKKIRSKAEQGEFDLEFDVPAAPTNQPTNQLLDDELWNDTPQITWGNDIRLRDWFKEVRPDGRIAVGFETMTTHDWQRWTCEQWFSLPLELRRRWWEETNYNKQPPSETLLQEVNSFFANLEASR